MKKLLFVVLFLALPATSYAATNLISWTDGSTNEDGFKVERCSGALTCTNFSQIGTPTAANVTSFTDSAALTGANCYRVRAYNTGGHSVYSNTACITNVAPPDGAPSQVTVTTVTVP